MAELTIDPGDAAPPEAQIAAEILQVHRDSYGVGAGQVDVHLFGDLVFVVLDELELQASEITLLEGGYTGVVQATRAAFQTEIAVTFKAIVERATGRTVISFLSNTSLTPPFSVEIFRLAS